MSLSQSLGDPVPDHLSIQSLPQKKYLPSSSNRPHCLKEKPYLEHVKPMPKMFGDERYAYTLIDIQDPRFQPFQVKYSEIFVGHQYDHNIIKAEWMKCHKKYVLAAKAFDSLPAGASEKAKQEKKELRDSLLAHLKELQEQRDQYEEYELAVNAHCKKIKENIGTEQSLERLRQLMTEEVRTAFNPSHTFWSTSFNPKHSEK